MVEDLIQQDVARSVLRWCSVRISAGTWPALTKFSLFPSVISSKFRDSTSIRRWVFRSRCWEFIIRQSSCHWTVYSPDNVKKQQLGDTLRNDASVGNLETGRRCGCCMSICVQECSLYCISREMRWIWGSDSGDWKSSDSWHVIPCSPVNVNLRFGGTYYFSPQGWEK
jgi:hypothetical protein